MKLVNLPPKDKPSKRVLMAAIYAYGSVLYLLGCLALPIVLVTVPLMVLPYLAIGPNAEPILTLTDLAVWIGVPSAVVWVHLFGIFLLEGDEDTGPENERGRSWFGNDGIDCSITAAQSWAAPK